MNKKIVQNKENPIKKNESGDDNFALYSFKLFSSITYC